VRHLVLILDEASGSMEIGRNHLMHELVKVRFAGPTKQALGFCGVSEEKPVLEHRFAKPNGTRN
jgi:hypothetical protein